MTPQVDWLLVFTNLASGVWTMEQAAAYAGVSVAHLEGQILAARQLGGRMADLAVRIIARYGLGAAATGAGTAVGARVLMWVLGVSLFTGVLIAGGYAAYKYFGSRTSNANRTEITKGTPCPSPLPTVTKKCPWTPEGYTVNPCTVGFCWDGGPQGALACKQEETVPNSGRTYTTDLVCSEGFEAVRDPCTNVILRCVPKAPPPAE